MNKFIKILATALILTVVVFSVLGLFNAINGNYMATSPFAGVLIIIGCVAFVGISFWIINVLWKNLALFGLITIIALQSCNYAKSNQQVVVSTDCGMTWKRINAGDAVPKAGMNMCYMKVVMPNYPMQGDSRFISNFKDRVRASVHIDYDYSITDPLAFIKQAKYLGKANKDADDSDALNPDAFEGAENTVIDKRIKDVSKSILLAEDIVEVDQADLENQLHTAANKVLEPLGIHLNFITLTFDLDEQTRQAIDVATAMKIYESKGIGEAGKDIVKAKAGATKVVVQNNTPENKPLTE